MSKSQTAQQRLKSKVLSEKQRRLVQENIGLVGVHMRRFVSGITQPRRDREWEDLFQEGCLGLMQAAVIYREESGIPFAAFALPRIHNAVSRAIQIKFSTVYVPPLRAANAKNKHVGDQVAFTRCAGDPQPQTVHRPSVGQLSDELSGRLAVRRETEALKPGATTVGECLRGKYERAVRLAAGSLSMSSSRRGDRHQLVQTLVDHRFMVPSDESKTPLRQIARDTRSSYARVAQCHKQITDAVAELLESDPEFIELSHMARTDVDGGGRTVDSCFEEKLVDASVHEFLRRYDEGGRDERAKSLHDLFRASPVGLRHVIRRHIAKLPMQDRESLFHSGDPAPRRRKENHPEAKRSSTAPEVRPRRKRDTITENALG